MEEQIQSIIQSIERKAASGTWRFSDELGTDPNDPEDTIASWHLDSNAARFLYDLVVRIRPQDILELGTGVGYSALWLAAAATTYGGHIDTVDYNDKKILVAKKHMNDAGLDAVVTINHQRIVPFIQNATTQYDLVFMDADKHHYQEYLDTLFPKVADGCLFVIDNAHNFKDRMVDFFDACKKHNLHTKELSIGNGLYIASKKPVDFIG